MGACYSTRGGSSDPAFLTDDIPGMPSSERLPPTLYKPYGGRYGFALQQQRHLDPLDSARAPLATLPDDTPSPVPKKAANMNRFGFNKPAASATRKLNAENNKKVESKIPGSSELTRRNKHGVAYNPRDGEKWRMIDEESSVSSAAASHRKGSFNKRGSRQSLASKTSSTNTVKDETTVSGGSSHEDIINANIPKQSVRPQPADVHIDGRIHIPDKKHSSRLPNFPRFRGFNRAPHGSTQESNKNNRTASNREASTKAPKVENSKNNKHNDAHDKATSASSSSSSSRFLRKGFFSSKSKSVQQPGGADKSSHKLSSSRSVDSAAIPKAVKPDNKVNDGLSTSDRSTSNPVIQTKPNEQLETKPETIPQTKALPDLGNPKLQQKLVEKSQKLPEGPAPIAMIDSVETTGSICSLDDELTMLDTEIHLDEDEEIISQQHHLSSAPLRRQRTGSGSAPPRRNRSSSGGSRSRSRDSLDGTTINPSAINNSSELTATTTTSALGSARVDKKPPLLRRHTEGGASGKKRSGSDHRGSGCGVDPEPIQELASLLEHNSANSLQSRRTNYQHGIRPASFPGPVPGTMAPPPPPSTLLKPPRGSLSSTGDGDHTGIPAESSITLDAYTYRQMLQDTTATKTMLLKLKRMLQDDDLGSPMTAGAPWSKLINGFKSQPSTPSYTEDGSSFKFPGTDGEIPTTIEALTQENADLRQQLIYQQHQIEEHERTIKLLQQQMTKYEHINTGEDDRGKAFTHSSTQTENTTQSCPPPTFPSSPYPGAYPGAGGSQRASTASSVHPSLHTDPHSSSSSSSTPPLQSSTLDDDKNVNSMVESGIDMTSPNSEQNLGPHSPIYSDITTSLPQHQSTETQPRTAISSSSVEGSKKDIPPPPPPPPAYHTQRSLERMREMFVEMEDIPEEARTPTPSTPVFKSTELGSLCMQEEAATETTAPPPPPGDASLTQYCRMNSMTQTEDLSPTDGLTDELMADLLSSTDETDAMTESQIWERGIMQQLEDEAEDEDEDEAGQETMQELLEQQEEIHTSPVNVTTYVSPGNTLLQKPGPVTTYASPVTSYVSPVTTYASPVTTYVSPVTTYVSPVTTLLEKQGIRSPPIATEIQIEKYIINGKSLSSLSARPDLLKGVIDCHEDSYSYSDPESHIESTMEITAKDYSGSVNEAKGMAVTIEKQSRDSGFCQGSGDLAAPVYGVYGGAHGGGGGFGGHGGFDYSPSDTSSFSMAVISNGAPDTEEEESDLPLDTPDQPDLPVFGGGGGITTESEDNKLLNGDRMESLSYTIEEEEEEDKEFITGGGEELAQPDVVTAEFAPVTMTTGLFVMNPMEMEKQEEMNKISKDLADVEDCMNRLKDLNDAHNYTYKKDRESNSQTRQLQKLPVPSSRIPAKPLGFPTQKAPTRSEHSTEQSKQSVNNPNSLEKTEEKDSMSVSSSSSLEREASNRLPHSSSLERAEQASSRLSHSLNTDRTSELRKITAPSPLNAASNVSSSGSSYNGHGLSIRLPASSSSASSSMPRPSTSLLRGIPRPPPPATAPVQGIPRPNYFTAASKRGRSGSVPGPQAPSAPALAPAPASRIPGIGGIQRVNKSGLRSFGGVMQK